ncbi:MAG: hypothetical protein IH851_03430 [Armatimonadetes bacterium]|nr:hypothetical protein [Armatimonadota bacterium]
MGGTPKVVRFLFGTHMHWTGMVWEWGEDTLANSMAALRRVIEETGLKCGLNLDGKGVEKLALAYPESVKWLRKALDEGLIELWGGTYSQPYGGLVGPESNIRQRVYGIRAFENILGRRPEIFAEEEFDFFPQLPQLLNQLGYRGALLFPQHTWHTPTWPKEDAPVILWRGVDGSTIPSVPYSDRCLMRGIPTALERLKEPCIRDADAPLMITWLETLDKPNWMWRTEFVIPYLKELRDADGYEIRPLLLGELFEKDETSEAGGQAPADAPVREYTLDDCFHGISAGKNGDQLPRLWRTAEQTVLRAEFLAAWTSFLGRPYPQFDSYPEWQLEEAWRNLCLAQGHDAYQCEGLTDFAGKRFAQMAIMHAQDVERRCERHLRERMSRGRLEGLPGDCAEPPERRIVRGPERLTVETGGVRASISINHGTLLDYKADGTELIAEPVGLPEGWQATGEPAIAERHGSVLVTTPISGPGDARGSLKWQFAPGELAVRGQLTLNLKELLPPGIMNSIRLPIRVPGKVTRWRVDTPFAVVDVHPNGEWLHRQPTGDWLTSPQTEEWIPKPIVHQSFVCMEWEGGGLQYVSRQNSLALARDDGLDAIIFGYDAWDEENWARRATIDFALSPVGGCTNCELLESEALARPPNEGVDHFSLDGVYLLWTGDGIHVTSVRKAGEELEVRLFETEGEPRESEITFPWAVESVRVVNPLGEESPKTADVDGQTVRLTLNAREIVTLRVLFEGKRTEYPDIDRYRSVWVG